MITIDVADVATAIGVGMLASLRNVGSAAIFICNDATLTNSGTTTSDSGWPVYRLDPGAATQWRNGVVYVVCPRRKRSRLTYGDPGTSPDGDYSTFVVSKHGLGHTGWER